MAWAIKIPIMKSSSYFKIAEDLECSWKSTEIHWLEFALDSQGLEIYLLESLRASTFFLRLMLSSWIRRALPLGGEVHDTWDNRWNTFSWHRYRWWSSKHFPSCHWEASRCQCCISWVALSMNHTIHYLVCFSSILDC